MTFTCFISEIFAQCYPASDLSEMQGFYLSQNFLIQLNTKKLDELMSSLKIISDCSFFSCRVRNKRQ
ncbi:hypothetical protein DP117_21565 [Brasilonema sp. UFV-L1]|nr:hypothetical protein [Brasilonema sp. UFV-L1]